MLEAIEAQLGKYFPCVFGSHPIHRNAFLSTSLSGKRIVNTILFSMETARLARNEMTLISLPRSLGLLI